MEVRVGTERTRRAQHDEPAEERPIDDQQARARRSRENDKVYLEKVKPGLEITAVRKESDATEESVNCADRQ